MITRPLDLAAKLRPEPRNFDWMFYVNGGLIVLFFILFGSQFVLGPALGVEFQLPEAEGANAGAIAATHHINITNTGSMYASDGLLTMERLPGWLAEQVKTDKQPMLRIFPERGVPMEVVMKIGGAAQNVGFKVAVAAVEPERNGEGRGRK